jgi:hypothetical protein
MIIDDDKFEQILEVTKHRIKILKNNPGPMEHAVWNLDFERGFKNALLLCKALGQKKEVEE